MELFFENMMEVERQKIQDDRVQFDTAILSHPIKRSKDLYHKFQRPKFISGMERDFHKSYVINASHPWTKNV